MFFASLTCLYLHKIFAANRLMLPFISRRDTNWPNLSICACSALKSKTNNSIGFFVLQKVATQKPCLWNGMKRPCYLFARKFYPEALDNLIHLFSNYTVIWFIHTVWDYLQTTHFLRQYPMKTAVDCEARTLLAPISTSKPQKIVGTVGMTQNYVSEQEGESESFCWCTTPCGCLLFTVCFPGCCVLRANFVVSIQLHTSPKSLILLCSGRGFRECMLWSYNSYILESQSLQQ